MTYELDNQIPKHRKKRTKRKPTKSDHKHIYESVIGEVYSSKEKVDYRPMEVCTVCGKAVWRKFAFTKPAENGFTEILFNLNEIQKEFPDLRIVPLLDSQI